MRLVVELSRRDRPGGSATLLPDLVDLLLRARSDGCERDLVSSDGRPAVVARPEMRSIHAHHHSLAAVLGMCEAVQVPSPACHRDRQAPGRRVPDGRSAGTSARSASGPAGWDTWSRPGFGRSSLSPSKEKAAPWGGLEWSISCGTSCLGRFRLPARRRANHLGALNACLGTP